MTYSQRTDRRPAVAAALILAGLISIMALSHPQAVTVRTGAPDPCEAARSFAAADRATIRVATASHEEQLAAEQAWHQARQTLAQRLPPGEARSAAKALGGARTVAGDEPWATEHQNAYRVLSQHVQEHCNVELPR